MQLAFDMLTVFCVSENTELAGVSTCNVLQFINLEINAINIT